MAGPDNEECHACGRGYRENPSPDDSLDQTQLEGTEPLGAAHSHDAGGDGVSGGYRHAQRPSHGQHTRRSGFGGKSDQLNAYNTFLGDPGFFDRDLTRYRNVTTSSLRDATASSLHHTRRIALSIVPRGRADLALPGSTPVDAR